MEHTTARAAATPESTAARAMDTIPLPAAASAPAQPAADYPMPTQPTQEWLTYRGEGFTLRYPPDAVLAPGRSHPNDYPGTMISGPRIHVPVDPERGPSDGPAWMLHVASFANPGTRSTEAWVDSIRDANAEMIDDDSLVAIPPPDTVSFGTVRALHLQPFCGDCEPHELYLASPRRRVILSYIGDASIPGDREAQRRVYAAIVSTFQWAP